MCNVDRQFFMFFDHSCFCLFGVCLTLLATTTVCDSSSVIIIMGIAKKIIAKQLRLVFGDERVNIIANSHSPTNEHTPLFSCIIVLVFLTFKKKILNCIWSSFNSLTYCEKITGIEHWWNSSLTGSSRSSTRAARTATTAAATAT